jgi:hypothetical protein
MRNIHILALPLAILTHLHRRAGKGPEWVWLGELGGQESYQTGIAPGKVWRVFWEVPGKELWEDLFELFSRWKGESSKWEWWRLRNNDPYTPRRVQPWKSQALEWRLPRPEGPVWIKFGYSTLVSLTKRKGITANVTRLSSVYNNPLMKL